MIRQVGDADVEEGKVFHLDDVTNHNLELGLERCALEQVQIEIVKLKTYDLILHRVRVPLKHTFWMKFLEFLDQIFRI